MMISRAHLKLTVLDIFRATMAQDGAAYISKFYVNNENQHIAFKNCRIQGLVVALLSETTFALDDGTGLIPVSVPQETALPTVGQYVEVLGALAGNISRSVNALCVREKTDPMEEVRRLLEQAAIHRDNLRFRQRITERFLSSDTSMGNPFEKLADTISEMIAAADPDKGVSIKEIEKVCGDKEIAVKVVHDLQNQGIIYQQGDAFFSL